MNRRRIATLALAMAGAIATAGCGSSSASGSAASGTSVTSTTVAPGTTATPSTMPRAGTAAMITIHGYDFGAPITVKGGTRVSVHNTDPETHSLSSDDGAFNISGVPPGTTATFVAPAKPGTYKFHCNFHANMHGSIVVTA